METKNMNAIEYVAPEVETLEVQVELGFAGSTTTPNDDQDGSMSGITTPDDF